MMISSPLSPSAATPTAALDARLAPIAASVAARLGAVCREWDVAEFQALVERIARTKLRWADRGDGD